MLEDFNPEYLKAADIEALYSKILPQAEINVFNAWVNYLIKPEDELLKKTYEVELYRLNKLKADKMRMIARA